MYVASAAAVCKGRYWTMNENPHQIFEAHGGRMLLERASDRRPDEVADVAKHMFWRPIQHHEFVPGLLEEFACPDAPGVLEWQPSKIMNSA
eukprot:7213519-Pyramimonas_sp.AAC.1